MEYFFLEQDPRHANFPVLTGLFHILDKRDINCENAHKIPDDIIVYAKCGADCDAPSVLTHDLLLISESVKDVLLFYNEDLILKNVAAIDYERNRQFIYFLPIFECVECFEPSGERGAVGAETPGPVLRSEAVRGKSMFRPNRDAPQKAVIRLDVAESLMRRGITDIKLTRIAGDRV
ncbi:MAG: hypothetical protein LBP73_09205 [Clostridiales Family XIII bacterium]|jgi:hypothetical protein|nr:hypothetical protein [Clostridiales Family XIII bacterium]